MLFSTNVEEGILIIPCASGYYSTDTKAHWAHYLSISFHTHQDVFFFFFPATSVNLKKKRHLQISDRLNQTVWGERQRAQVWVLSSWEPPEAGTGRIVLKGGERRWMHVSQIGFFCTALVTGATGTKSFLLDNNQTSSSCPVLRPRQATRSGGQLHYESLELPSSSSTLVEWGGRRLDESILSFFVSVYLLVERNHNCLKLPC